MLPRVTKVSAIKEFSSDLMKNILSRRSFTIPAYCHYSRGYVLACVSHVRPKNRVLWQLRASNLCTVRDEKNSSIHDLTAVQFERISDETLESLTEYFDELVENETDLTDADVAYRDGVLKVVFGDKYGTYVINRQSPNKQIWLSSPKSGPKRYDFLDGRWIYKHDRISLHELLDNEIPLIVKRKTCFYKCSYGRK